MNAARATAAALRRDLEEALASRVPGALTPRVRLGPARNSCGVEAIDSALGGGLPEGAITELVGAECSGRTSAALAYAAAVARAGNLAAWVDVDDRLDPQSAALCGVDLARLLWVRCGAASSPAAREPRTAETLKTKPATAVAPLGTPLAGGGCGSPHPRSEGRGMDRAIQHLLVTPPVHGAEPTGSALPRRNRAIGTPSAPNRQLPRWSADREEQIPTDRQPSRRAVEIAKAATPAAVSQTLAANSKVWCMQTPRAPRLVRASRHEWTALDQALKAADLILQAGGFSLLVLDLGSTPAEMSWRVPLASWFRFRAACARTRSSLLLLTRHPCARSGAELTVRLAPGQMAADGRVLANIRFQAEVERARFANVPTACPSNVVSLRKPPGRAHPGTWKGRTAWAM